ncbi:MAG TPA: hypothetical protein VK564_01450, partial [Thermodesulfobacteriota bacterium]|nr:hypothetical protein [Thermodesulfobacteriota bacterium]
MAGIGDNPKSCTCLGNHRKRLGSDSMTGNPGQEGTSPEQWSLDLGASWQGERVRFKVWAPKVN